MSIQKPIGIIAKPTTIKSIAINYRLKESEVRFSNDIDTLEGVSAIYHKPTEKVWLIPNLSGEKLVEFNPPKLKTDKQDIDLTEFNIERNNFHQQPQYSFESGFTLTNGLETVIYQGIEYRWGGAFPKVVPEQSTIETSGGVDYHLWISISNIKNTIYFSDIINKLGANEEAIDHAILMANKGVAIISNGTEKINISRLPSVRLTSNAKLKFDNLIIETDISISPKGGGIFYGSGSVDESLYADLLSDVEEYQTTYSITDASKFEVNDFISARYTVRQDNKVIPTNNFSDDFNLYEFTAKIIAISGNDITLDVCRSYKVFANPPAGGKFRIYKCNPIENVEVSGVTVVDKNNSESASHSVVALYFSANHKIENIRGENMKGTVAYFENCYGHVSKYTKNIQPRSVVAGRGYTEQLIACSNGISIAPYSEAGRHCVDHAAGSTGMVVFRGKGKGMKDGVFGCHGSFENNIVYSECEADSSPQSPLIYLATSGEVFGNHCKDIKIISPKGRGMGALLYSAVAESRTKNVTIKDPDYRKHEGTNYAVRCNMSDTSITGGYIDGGIQVAAVFAPENYYSNLNIENSVITPAKNGIVLHTGKTFGKKIAFNNCDFQGMFNFTDTEILISINNCNYEILNDKITPSGAVYRLSDFTIKNSSVTSNNVISSSLKSEKILIENVKFELGLGSTIEMDCVTNQGYIIYEKVTGNTEFISRRAKVINIGNNSTETKGYNFSIIQSPNCFIGFCGNQVASESDYNLHINDTGQGNISIQLLDNVHSDKLFLANGSENVIVSGVANANICLASTAQPVQSTIIKGVNVNYS